MKIAQMQVDHWQDVRKIYQQGINTGQATFEESPPDNWEIWTNKFLPDLSMVCLDGDRVIGWAAVSPTSNRPVYKGVGELSLYVATDHQGRGGGRKLMESLIRESERAGFWTLQAGIFPENQASLELHQQCGFRVVGRREKIGRMTFGPQAGEWRDVLLLERRSELEGGTNL
jgi:phosphinothricin acetyltransferase